MNNWLTGVIGWLLLSPLTSEAQTSRVFGNNPQSGHYYNVGDARIYYERYGVGKPIVLLHGGLYGYIDEFERLIPKLAQTHQVITIATRGHGKSEIGTKAISYTQLADDAFQIIRSITQDSVLIIGFSDGGIAGYTLAAKHPELVQKLVAIGAPRRPSDRTISRQREGRLTVEQLAKQDPDFVTARQQLMPDPTRWREFLTKLDGMWNQASFISDEALQGIQCPVLLMAGDRDPSFQLEKLTEAFQLLPKGGLAIIPGCGHTVLTCNFEAVWAAISSFIP